MQNFFKIFKSIFFDSSDISREPVIRYSNSFDFRIYRDFLRNPGSTNSNFCIYKAAKSCFRRKNGLKNENIMPGEDLVNKAKNAQIVNGSNFIRQRAKTYCPLNIFLGLFSYFHIRIKMINNAKFF